jgi:hypothetical protein
LGSLSSGLGAHGTMRWGSMGKIVGDGMRHPARAVATKRGHAWGIRMAKGVR